MVHRMLGDASTLTAEEKGFAGVQDWVSAEPGAAGGGFTRVIMTSLKEGVLSQLLEPDAGPRLCRVRHLRPCHKGTRRGQAAGAGFHAAWGLLATACPGVKPSATACGPTPSPRLCSMQELAHLYHYYLHGEQGNREPGAPASGPTIILRLMVGTSTVWEKSLAEVGQSRWCRDVLGSATTSCRTNCFVIARLKQACGGAGGVMELSPPRRPCVASPRTPSTGG